MRPAHREPLFQLTLPVLAECHNRDFMEGDQASTTIVFGDENSALEPMATSV
jgi:hypothetical protein